MTKADDTSLLKTEIITLHILIKFKFAVETNDGSRRHSENFSFVIFFFSPGTFLPYMSCMTSGCPRLIVVCLTLLSLHSKISALALQTCVLKLIYPYPHFDTGNADEASSCRKCIC